MTEEEAKSMGDLFPDLGPEAPVISGIAHDRSEALATVRGVPNELIWSKGNNLFFIYLNFVY